MPEENTLPANSDTSLVDVDVSELAEPSQLSAIIDEVLTALKQQGAEMVVGAAKFLPQLIVALIIFIVGIIFSKIVKTVVGKVLKGIKIDELSEKVGMQGALHKMGLKGSLAQTIPKALYFLLFVLTIRVTADAANFTDVSAFIDKIFAFTPKVVTSFIIIVIGVLVGDVIQGAVFNALDDKGLDYANSLSKIVFGLVFIVFLTVSLSQVGIETKLLNATVVIVLSGVSLALALAIGLGLKGHAGNVVAAIYVRDIYRRGSEIEIDGKHFQIMGVGPVTTKLKNEAGEFVVLPNITLVNTTVKGIVNE